MVKFFYILKLFRTDLFTWLLCCNIYITTNAQTGNYYITNYTPASYASTDQNRGVVQDKFGRIYSANLSGVLNYDGQYWKLATLPKESAVISIQADKNGVLFVGGVNELGYINSNKEGNTVYNSLTDKLPEEEKNFSEVWSTLSAKNAVYFGSNEKLIVFDYTSLKTINAPIDSLFHTFYNINDFIFVRQFNVGFKVYLNNELVFLEGSQQFSTIKVRFVLPKTNNDYWVGTENGMYIMHLNVKQPNKSTFTKVPSKIDNWMMNKHVYCGLKLKNGKYIVGSQNDGILYLDESFGVIKAINSKNGLQDDNINSIFEDDASNIWLSLNKGISYIELNSAITKWDKHDGINGTVESSCRYRQTIFLGTDKGLQYFTGNKFEQTEITVPVWDMVIANKKLLIATDGIYIFDGENYHYALKTGVVYKILIDKKDSTLLYIGGDGFIIKAQINNNEIKILEEYEAKGEIRSILQENTSVYFSVNGQGIIRLNTINKKLKIYAEKDGLPSVQDNVLFEYNNKIYLGTANGIYTLKEDKTPAFIRQDEYNLYSSDYQIAIPTIVLDKLFYQVTGGKNELYKIDELASLKFFNNRLINDNTVLKRIKDVNAKHFYKSNDLVYISTNDGLFCYNLLYDKKPRPFITLISSVLFKDSIIYQNVAEANNYNPTLSYTDNRIEFKLAASNFIDKDEMEFAYYIENSEKGFGKWVKQNNVSFSNLTEGRYVFHAKSRDIMGNQGKEISFIFTILPPWYRTIWAYILYIFSFIVLIILIIKLYTRTLQERNIMLEQTITLRTKTIVAQKQEIEHKHKEITDSINYAERIQRSFLATKELLDENLNIGSHPKLVSGSHEMLKQIQHDQSNYFVFFKPKDVVSGDFYWAAKLSNGHFALATADSTGHGVPGAIMSLLNVTSLEKAIEHYTDPANILNHTRQTIIERLKKDGSEEGGKDGMDCSLLAFDFISPFEGSAQRAEDVAAILHIATANNPVWIIRKRVAETLEVPAYELIEIKPDKMPVGKSDIQDQPFTLHTVELQNGDTIYTLTDGFPDQFGGPKGKKFMSKKLKELLLANVHLPITQQKELLDTTFKNWAGDLEQVDDVCVIGIRV